MSETILACGIIATRPGRTLFLAHRDELINQTVDKLTRTLPERALEIGIVKAEQNATWSPIVVASVQTLARHNRLAQLPPTFHTVIVDEAHHAPALSYELILEYLSVFEPYGPDLLGLTATPQRTDKVGLHEIFEQVVHHRTIPEMIRAGYLCNLRGLSIQVDIDFARLKTHHGDYSERQLEQVLLANQAPMLVVQAWQEYAEGLTG